MNPYRPTSEKKHGCGVLGCSWKYCSRLCNPPKQAVVHPQPSVQSDSDEAVDYEMQDYLYKWYK